MSKPFNGWVMCDRCKDVHRESDRVMRPSKFKGLAFSHCPKCSAVLQAPLASVPKQRELFEVQA